MFPLCSWSRVLTINIQMSRHPLPTFLILLCATFHASTEPYTVDDIAVYEKDGVYHINITADIAAPPDHVRQVLTDYVHIYRLSDSIIESSVLQSSRDGKTQVKTLALCCTALFCKEVTRVEEVRILASGNLQSKILPEQSDFISGEALWKIKAVGERTQLSYQASIEPDFFIPPILGTRMVINNMRKEFNATFNRIGHIARINEAREWDNDFSFVRVIRPPDDGPCKNEILTSLQ